MRKKSIDQRVVGQGFTLLELTVGILVMMSLISVFFIGTGAIGRWQKAKDANLVLMRVETAQRAFLADHPQRAVSSLTEVEVAAYLEGAPSTLPTGKDLSGNVLTVDVTVAPPVLLAAGGAVYDPSGHPRDSLWDAGK